MNTDLRYLYKLTEEALQNIRNIEKKMKKYDRKGKKTRKNYGGRKRKQTRKKR